MIKVNYPLKKPLVKQEGESNIIFCLIRKRWMKLTPEEWVRQNFLLFLTEILHFPVGLIAVEKQIVLWEVKKRFDIIVYGKDSRPLMIIECKELNQSLSENVFRQLNQYNTNIQAGYLFITNGRECRGFKKENNFIEEVYEFPVY